MSFEQWTQKQVQRLAQTLTSRHTEAEHTACLDALEAYIDAQLAQRDYARLFPAVAQHLDSCVACAESYALVYDARTVEAIAPNQMRAPTPDLRFLQSSSTERLRHHLAAAIERIAPQQVRIRLTQALLDLLPPPALAPALRSVASAAPLMMMALDAPDKDGMHIQLSIYEDLDAPDRCSLRVQVALTDREWPELNDILITLRSGSMQRSATTDPWGEAVITGVSRSALDGLQLEVAADSPPQTST